MRSVPGRISSVGPRGRVKSSTGTSSTDSQRSSQLLLLTCRAVENLGLKDDCGVGVPDSTEEKTLGLDRRANDGNLETRSSEEKALGALRVVKTAVTNTHGRGTNGEGASRKWVGSTAGVMLLGGFIDELVKRREDLSR